VWRRGWQGGNERLEEGGRRTALPVPEPFVGPGGEAAKRQRKAEKSWRMCERRSAARGRSSVGKIVGDKFGRGATVIGWGDQVKIKTRWDPAPVVETAVI